MKLSTEIFTQLTYTTLFRSDEKIGSIIKGNRADGKRLRERFLSGLPTLRTLKERVDRASEKGYLKGLDGRKILLRHKHAALNTLLQGGGAIAMKKALVILEDNIRSHGYDATFVAWQIQVIEKDAEAVGKLGVQAIEQAGQHYNMRCPLTGEYKIGDSWYETH